MFCQHCQKCLALALENADVDRYPEIILHFHNRSWFKSISDGCYPCRWIWYNLNRVAADVDQTGHINTDLIPPLSLEEFTCQKGKFQKALDVNWGQFSSGSHDRKRDKLGRSLLWMCSRTPRSVLSLCGLQKRIDDLRVRSSSLWSVLIRASRGKLNNALELHVLVRNMKVPVIRGNDQMTLEICPTPASKPAKLQYYMDAQDQRSTKISSHQWKEWLVRCLNEHNECHLRSSNKFVPKRLIEIVLTSAAPPRWRLVESSILSPVPYISLSHCWGSFSGLQLTKATAEAFRHGMNTRELGQTFIDALEITAELGYKYIWIDSLCIYQDDLDDWKEQAPAMARIYTYADCNIAASWASDDAQGCYHNRDPTMCEPASLQLGLRTSQEHTFTVYDRWCWTNDVSMAKLNTRAWVVQERFLSRRQLNFTSNQVYWECKSLSASEQYPVGLPSGIADGVKPAFSLKQDVKYGRRSWCTAVQMYTRSHLSYDTDRMIAIAGLAMQYRDMTQDTYVAGLWREDIINQLCWKALRDREHEVIAPYQGPSWSWTGISGPVLMDQMWYDSLDVFQLAEVSSVDFVSKSTTGLDEFCDCRLTVRGLSAWADTSGTSFWDTLFTLRSESGLFGDFSEIPAWDVYWDIGPTWEDLRDACADESGQLTFFFLFIRGFGRDWCASYNHEDFNSVQGLVLRQDSESPEAFRKVGTFEGQGLSELPSQLAQQLGISSVYADTKTLIDLDDVRLAPIVNTITIV